MFCLGMQAGILSLSGLFQHNYWFLQTWNKHYHKVVSCSPASLLASLIIIMMSCCRHEVIVIKMEARSRSGLCNTNHKVHDRVSMNVMNHTNFKVASCK